jgi:hypothetical protein
MKIKNTNFLFFLLCILIFHKSYSLEKKETNIVIKFGKLTCEIDECSFIGGECLQGKRCICKKCYSTLFNKETQHQLLCNYSQSSSLIAGILEFLFPIGIGHFYIGRISIGIYKMLIGYIMFFGIYVIVIYYFIYKRTSESELRQPLDGGYQRLTVTLGEDAEKIKKVVLVSQLIFVLFHLIDVYYLFSGIYMDGNNMPLC